jgi:hypothetical protein
MNHGKELVYRYQKFNAVYDMFRSTWPSSGNTYCVQNSWEEVNSMGNYKLVLICTDNYVGIVGVWCSVCVLLVTLCAVSLPVWGYIVQSARLGETYWLHSISDTNKQFLIGSFPCIWLQMLVLLVRQYTTLINYVIIKTSGFGPQLQAIIRFIYRFKQPWP